MCFVHFIDYAHVADILDGAPFSGAPFVTHAGNLFCKFVFFLHCGRYPILDRNY